MVKCPHTRSQGLREIHYGIMSSYEAAGSQRNTLRIMSSYEAAGSQRNTLRYNVLVRGRRVSEKYTTV